ncbi:MAG: S41 family peptidase [Vicinamibacterales bacterium]|nr:S41 family peptidase [Vicinamibacterales bacterium]MDP7690872.1 S41 family peptidase [Vicinamibacterales bacterium]
MTDRTRFVVVIVTAPILAYTLVGGFLSRVVAREDTYRHLRVFEDVVSLITNNYVDPVEPERIMQGALWGLTEGLDPESTYLTPDEVSQYEADDPNDEVGVGLVLTRQYYIQVVAARDGSPAAEAGLLPGDYIREIDDNSTRVMSVVRGRQLLHGAPGSTVTLNVIRGNAAEPVEIELQRGAGRSANVTSRLTAPGVGYLRIAEFDDTTTDAIEAAAGTLERQGAERLLIDLRGTATGAFETGIDAARLFADADTLVIRETSTEQVPMGQGTEVPGQPSIRWPVVLITSPGTAGAAELFAAALTDTGRADSVGFRTAGRAAEQTLIRLPDGGGLLLTATQYLKPSGEPIHRVGVEPAVVAQQPRVELGEPVADPDEDPVLDRALEHLIAMPTA